jgi:hypothetical protein
MLLLYDFQLQLLNKANEMTEASAKCLRDCVNYSGVVAYELNALNTFSDYEVIRKVIGYQMTRFNVPKDVKMFIESFGINPFEKRK